LLEEMKVDGDAPVTDCDGAGVCAKCKTDVIEQPETPVPVSKKKKNLYDINKLDFKKLYFCLACNRQKI